MANRKIFTLLIITTLLCFTACSLTKAVQLSQCVYSFQKITHVTWAGLNFMNLPNDYANFDIISAAKCAKAIANKDFMLTVGLSVIAKNPTQRTAAIAGFDYIILYKNREIATGQSLNPADIHISAGSSTTIPLNLNVNLSQITHLQSFKAVNETILFVDELKKIGKNRTNFSLKIRPHFRVGKNNINGTYIPISSI